VTCETAHISQSRIALLSIVYYKCPYLYNFLNYFTSMKNSANYNQLGGMHFNAAPAPAQEN
jgi:hypothetical protein